jgi:LPXTG-motif cell wall-anchored protein
MSTRYTRSVLAATVVACAFVGWASQPAIASDHQMAVTAVGCLQGEREYRHETHDSKFAGTGHGLGNEYILTNAVIGGPEFQAQPITEQEAAANCLTSGGSGQTIELKGSAESSLAGMIGRRVVIRGMLLHTKHDVPDVPVGTSGTYTPGPTGGGWFNPLKHDNKLREISVESFSLVPVLPPPEPEVIIGAQETVIEAPPAVAPPQAPAPAPEPQPVAPAPVLPKTASQVPTIGLIGLLSLACGVGLSLFNRRRARLA